MKFARILIFLLISLWLLAIGTALYAALEKLLATTRPDARTLLVKPPTPAASPLCASTFTVGMSC